MASICRQLDSFSKCRANLTNAQSSIADRCARSRRVSGVDVTASASKGGTAASLAVPVSIISTFGFMYLAGYSLNNLSLMALTLCVGFVVDDAIVVLENIHRRIEEGEPPLVAALRSCCAFDAVEPGHQPVDGATLPAAFGAAGLDVHAEFVHVVAGLDHHVQQVRHRRALVAAHVGDARLQQRLRDREDALAAKHLPGGHPQLLDFARE